MHVAPQSRQNQPPSDESLQIHKLLNRLVGCVPEGSAQRNEIVLQSCAMVRAAHVAAQQRTVQALYNSIRNGRTRGEHDILEGAFI